MSTTLFNALSALQTHQRAMTVTAHNIANATTPGYTRQRAILATNVPQQVRPGQVGRGVQIAEINRVADSFITERLRGLQSESGRLNELDKLMGDLELTFNEPSTAGFSNSINRFFAAFEDLSNNPESNATRSGTIEQLRTFTAAMNDIGNELARQRETVGFAMDQLAREVNRLTSQLAQMNQDIRRATASQTNPNDLLDTRDRLLQELSGIVQVRVRYEPDGSILAELDGRLLVGIADNAPLTTERNNAGQINLIFADDKRIATLSGGRMHALSEMNNQILPDIIRDFDDLALAMMRQMNTIHATGANHTARPTGHVGTITVPQNHLTTNLDDPSLVQPSNMRAGIPEGLLPSFVDANGNPRATNLTINVLNTQSGVAEKYTIRYEPGSLPTPASRSLKDLVDAINTGHGGGFSVHPAQAGGIPNLSAQYLSVDGGYRFSLSAASGYSVDFSRSLDLQPAQRAWTGEDVTVSNSAPGSALALAGQRIGMRVDGSNIAVFRIDPVTRNEDPLGSVPIASGGTIAGLAISPASIDPDDYRDGESFAVDIDADGNVINGSIQAHWSSDAADFRVYGRYTGAVSMIPDQPWSMEVVQGGQVGAPLGAASPNNPPMVKFTFNVGDGSGNAQQETLLVTLDDNYPPGSQIPIAEGVYVVFGSGQLYESVDQSNYLSFTVDGQPDQAGLLASLGVQSLFSGSSARDIRIADALVNSPTNLMVGFTRAAGDNGNVLSLLDSRREKLLDNDAVTFEEFYQGRISEIAVRVNQVQQLKSNQSAIQASLENRRDEISGVSIDEEVGLLILQQQAYQAAARIINIERENIQALMGIIG